ncbi:MAG: D-lactate dehydrogenase [Clostridia bacterium]|nr:D-lactate dehydrogenase [Clostridia bacterium]
MKTIAFFDTKPYDKEWFNYFKKDFDFDFKYFENKLNCDTAFMTSGCDGVVAFVNDIIDKKVIDILYENKINIIALRSAGYNNVDFKAAFNKIHVVRVPAYSPYAVAEHALALLLTLNRKIHRAYNRTRDNNFSLVGLQGFDLNGKTVGIIGTGKIGQVFVNICKGLGMKIVAYDPYPSEGLNIEYISPEELYKRSDIISLHCPLTKDTHHIINAESIKQMKDDVYIINTSRGALIDSEALLEAIKAKKIGGAGLDVYEEESELFFEDFSNTILQDDVLARLVSMPNVIVTSHQGFFTKEALHNIAKSTLENLNAFFNDKRLENEICYKCIKESTCDKKNIKRCF